MNSPDCEEFVSYQLRMNQRHPERSDLQNQARFHLIGSFTAFRMTYLGYYISYIKNRGNYYG
jgi:hypothetical protein